LYSAELDTAPSPEAELLLECIRQAFGKGAPERAAALAERVDRAAFESLAEAHGLAPLVSQPAFRENARRVLVLTGELCRVVRLLESEGIAALALKGTVLAHLVYRDPAHRIFTDLDILVKPEQFEAALRVLSRDGYRVPGSNYLREERRVFGAASGELHLQHAERRIWIDLHRSLSPSNFPQPLTTREAFERARIVDLNGQPVTTLSSADTLLHLCVHGTQHYWASLSMIADVCGAIQAAPTTDYTELFGRARRSGTERMLSFGLAAAGCLMRGGAGTQTESWLRRIAASQKNGSGTARELWLQVRLIAGHKRRLSYLWSRVLTPQEPDWLSLRLPHRALFFLYYPWRILRLAWRWIYLGLR